MKHLIIPEGYESPLNLYETQIAIKMLKDKFQSLLAKKLSLTRVSAPLFVEKGFLKQSPVFFLFI